MLGDTFGTSPGDLEAFGEKKFFEDFSIFFALILAYFWLKSGIQLRVKNSKTLIFSK